MSRKYAEGVDRGIRMIPAHISDPLRQVRQPLRSWGKAYADVIEAVIEQDGERYGYAGLQFSYVTTFDVTPDSRISKVSGVPENTEARIKASGMEVAAIATLLRSFYLGIGIGHLNGTMEVTAPTRPCGPVVTRTEQIDVLPSHYVFPFGFMIRAGTNFVFNLGGVVRWKGIFTQPSAFVGLGSRSIFRSCGWVRRRILDSLTFENAVSILP